MTATFWLEDVILFLVFFVGVPAIAAAIGYAAWMGKPENWDRSMYWTAFVTTMVVSFGLNGVLTANAGRCENVALFRADSIVWFGGGLIRRRWGLCGGDFHISAWERPHLAEGELHAWEFSGRCRKQSSRSLKKRD
jgi:hypothetical protein